MLSKDHIRISFVTVFLPVIFLFLWIGFDTDTTMAGIVAVLVGVFIGSLLPDTDLPVSKLDTIYNYRVPSTGTEVMSRSITRAAAKFVGIFAFAMGKITKWIINPIVSITFSILLRKPIKGEHRGITHSVFGIVLTCLIAGLAGFFLWFFLKFPVIYLAFVPGLFIGEMLHILEDSCTVSGVSPLYPVWGNQKIAGTIHTGDNKDFRPAVYLLLLLITPVALTITWLQQPNADKAGNYFVVSTVGSEIAWVLIFLFSQVRIKENNWRKPDVLPN